MKKTVMIIVALVWSSVTLAGGVNSAGSSSKITDKGPRSGGVNSGG